MIFWNWPSLKPVSVVFLVLVTLASTDLLRIRDGGLECVGFKVRIAPQNDRLG
jgi:hypothetical protein